MTSYPHEMTSCIYPRSTCLMCQDPLKQKYSPPTHYHLKTFGQFDYHCFCGHECVDEYIQEKINTTTQHIIKHKTIKQYYNLIKQQTR